MMIEKAIIHIDEFLDKDVSIPEGSDLFVNQV
jgi:hypothetical protein